MRVTGSIATLIVTATLGIPRFAGAQQTADSSRLGALNPEVSVAGDVRVNVQKTGGPVNNFEARSFELGFQSALDRNTSAKFFVIDRLGGISVEEGYVTFGRLPAGLSLDAGRFRLLVGELNRWHEHALPEDEYPLVIRRFTGDGGLVGNGVSLHSTFATHLMGGTYDLTLQATSAADSVLFYSSGRPAVNGQLSGLWHPTGSISAKLSVSGLYGTNPDSALKTKLGVGAATIVWHPGPASEYGKELTLRGEFWSLNREYTLPGFAPTSYGGRIGGYGDAAWMFNRHWTASFRADYAESPFFGQLAHEWGMTPTLTYWPDEFVAVRGIVDHSRDVNNITHDRFSMQVVFAMGSHGRDPF